MKRVRVLVWLCVGLIIGFLFLYYFNEQSTLIQKIPKEDRSNEIHQSFREKMTGMTENREIKRTTMNNEKEMHTWEDISQTITEDKPETSSKISTKQETSASATEPGQIDQNRTNIESSKTENFSDKYSVLQKYPPYQSAEEMEFPTTENKEPRIPHIIHQIFCNESVPEPYRGFIETFTTHNPKWQYRLWTRKSGRKLLEDRHPHLVPMFDIFGKCNDKQFDMIKYAVLHEFGGVYADFDMENLRPLDKATLKFACIIPVEPFENAAMRFQTKMKDYDVGLFKNTRTPPRLIGDVMLCRPKHPFLQFLLTNLVTAVSYLGDREQVTGSQFLTEAYRKYNGIDLGSFGNFVTNNASNSPNFYKGNRTEDGNDTVYIPNSQYFSDTVDPKFLSSQGHLMKCYKFDETIYIIKPAKQACAEFERRKKIRENRKYTFIVHHWHNSKMYNYAKWVKSLERIHIREIVPGCIL